MRKPLTLTIILALLILLVSSCTPKDEGGEDNQGGEENHIGSPTPHADGESQGELDGQAPATENVFYLVGKVSEVSDRILIDVTEGEYADGPYWILVSAQTEIYDTDGGKITADGIKIGDTVKVIYGGQVMMSYPPQVAAIEVRVQ